MRNNTILGTEMKVKYIGMILLSSFIGIILNPEILTASDSTVVVDLGQSSVVETVVLAPEASVVPVAETTSKATTAAANNVVMKTTTVKTATAKTTETKAADQIKFAWGAQTLENANSTDVDAGANAMKYGRLIWAHNNTAFNNIKTLKIGDTFTITMNGTIKKYQVKANPINGMSGVALKRINESTVLYEKEAEEISWWRVETAWEQTPFEHDIVLTTCDGVWNGVEYSHRYIVVADEIH